MIEIYGVILTYFFANTTFLLFKVKATFINIGDKGDCLGKVYMDGFVLRYVLIELVGVVDRAAFDAGRATGAFVFVNIPGLPDQGYLETACFALYAVDLSIGQYLDVRMPADLDQLR